jgi:hypothetical protein
MSDITARIAAQGGIDRCCQTGKHPLADRSFDLYETPPCATEALLAVEPLRDNIWDPADGRGAISNVLRAHGHEVFASDLIAYDGSALDRVANFFAFNAAPRGCTCIVTNPPFQCADIFVRHALGLVPHVVCLLRLAFLESVGRSDILERRGLRVVHVFRNRLPMLHRDGWTGKRASNAMAFGWFVWSRGYSGPTVLNRISWKKEAPTRNGGASKHNGFNDERDTTKRHNGASPI